MEKTSFAFFLFPKGVVGKVGPSHAHGGTPGVLVLVLVSSVYLLKLVIPRKPHRQSSTDLWASCRGQI